MTLRGGVTSRNEASARLLEDYQKLGSWTAVGKKYGVSRALAWRVANEGYVPRSPELRRRLGIMRPPRDLFAMSPDQLRWMIEHRIEV